MNRTLPFPMLPWLVLLLAGLPFFTSAQTDLALLRELAEENKKSVEALALYPADARLAMLESAKHPEVLVKMQGIREKTSAAFRTLLEDFPRDEQAIFYELTRYPDLVATLVARRGDRSGQREALAVLEEKKRDAALDVADDYPGVLAKIDELNRTTAGAFERLVSPYPAPAQAAFRQMLELPEALDILNEDLRFTVLVGDVYKENPAWVIHKMDSISLAVARAHADELDEWKKSLENDPAAREELRSAAREYATEQGYDDEDYPYADDQPDRVVVEHRYYYHPYSWWYGYPYWHPYPHWRPYPWWWDCGWYWHPGGIVVVYMPSHHFVHWYFDRPHHHHHYNHLSTHFVNHYYGHRRSGTSISTGVGQWRDRNREVISEDWISDKSRLPERLREYGRFEEKRQEYNQRNPGRTATPGEFLEKNTRKYPELDRSRTQAAEEVKRQPAEQPRTRDWAPAKEPVKVQPRPERRPQPEPPQTEPQRKPRTDEPQKPTTPPPPPPRKTDEPKTKPPAPEKPATPRRKDDKVNDAQDYHRQKWEESRQKETVKPPPTRQPQPQPRTQPKTKKGRD